MTIRLPAVLLCLVTTAAFAQRVAIPPFSGPKAAVSRTQLVTALCDAADCVPAAKVTSKGKPDWKKANSELVTLFVTGKVSKKGKSLSVELALLSKGGSPKKKSFALETSGKLSAKSLRSATEFLNVERPASPDSVGPPLEESPSPELQTRVPEPAPSKPAPKTAAVKPTRDSIEVVNLPPVRESQGAGGKPKFLLIDVGADIVTRKLSYAGIETQNLRRYDLPPVGQPSFGLKFYPLALITDGVISGLGLEGQMAFATWVKSVVDQSPAASYETSLFRVDAGLRFDLVPVKSFPLTISPYAGLRWQAFTLAASAQGPLLGLPNVSYLGLHAGLGLEVPIIVGRLSAFGRVGIIPVFQSGDIVSASYFPKGSNFGFDINGGLAVTVIPLVQIRASFQYTQYSLTFQTAPGDTYIAKSASDVYLGGNIGLRFSF
jgi:hypothetical protein